MSNDEEMLGNGTASNGKDGKLSESNGEASNNVTKGGAVQPNGMNLDTKRKTKRRKNRPTIRNNPKGPHEAETPTKTPNGRKFASKRKRNGRIVRLVSIDTNVESNTQAIHAGTTGNVPPLPRNQYTTTLRRRAIRKAEENLISLNDDSGDISLGMKLIVAGGRVIVQSLNSLEGGLASPAQLVGIIQRGDVLLAIGNLSLTNLPIDKLMEGLQPLSTPNASGCYERFLTLRFEAGAGMRLLKNHEEEHRRPNLDIPSDPMFSLFPMVDNLSGEPLFEPDFDPRMYQQNETNDDFDNEEEAKDKFPGDNDDWRFEKEPNRGDIESFEMNLDSLISLTLANERNFDRERFESEYFDWREDFSLLLRRTMPITTGEDVDEVKHLSKKERLEIGLKIIAVIKKLEQHMEMIDKGGTRSNKNYGSSISVRSGSSSTVKRQYNMDGTITSVRSTVPDDESFDSDDSMDDVDPDQLLLSLAARDPIWRKEVISSLQKAVHDLEHSEEETIDDSTSKHEEMDLRQQLGQFLFRENRNQETKQQAKSLSSPPSEVTQVLFDLTSFIASTANDDFTVFGGESKLSSNHSSYRSGTTGTGGRGRAALRADMLLAKHFVLDEALPHWLQSFQPLELDQRGLLWPTARNGIGSMGGTRDGNGNKFEWTGRSFDGDTLTVDSSPSRRVHESKKKDSRADDPMSSQEGRPEPETCFLVTYFYSQKFVGGGQQNATSVESHKIFVEKYGAYLQLHTCLSLAASVRDKISISAIVEAAKSDPSHINAIKEIQDSDSLIFYDPGKLSAVLHCIETLRFETEEYRRKRLRDLCVSGFPDIQPWQVRDACRCVSSEIEESGDECSDDVMEDLYYSYLSQLLHPLDGHEIALQDSDLVREFCEMSVDISRKKERDIEPMTNFINIASPFSIHHQRYRRDLMMLLDLSMSIQKYNVSLSLVDEIFENQSLVSNEVALSHALTCLAKIGTVAISNCLDPSKETMGFETLRDTLKLFEKAASSKAETCRNAISLPNEVVKLIQEWQTQTKSSGDDSIFFDFMDFVIDSSSTPSDVVKALVLQSDCNTMGVSLYPRLEELLCRGIQFAAVNGDLSGTLLRLKQARKTFKELDSQHHDSGVSYHNPPSEGGIWAGMEAGMIAIEK